MISESNEHQKIKNTPFLIFLHLFPPFLYRQQPLIIMTFSDLPCPLAPIRNLPLPHPSRFSHFYRPNHENKTVVLGIEGSANKVGVGVLCYDPETDTYQTLSNPRKTYVSPVGCGFLPKETSWHHQAHVVALVRAALDEAYPDDTEPQRYVRIRIANN